MLNKAEMNAQKLVIIMKAITCLLRENLHVSLKEKVIKRLAFTYKREEGDGWFDVRDKICDIFIAASVFLVNSHKDVRMIQNNKTLSSLVIF